MNIRKPADYNTLLSELDKLIAAQLPQMELYCEIGRLVSGRAEKGAAAVASEYLQATYPAVNGFSPRNLRRMRTFYATYKDSPEIMRLAMELGWTQNVAILERCDSNEERAWYIQVALHFGWKKAKLLEAIESQTWLHSSLDEQTDSCYTEGIENTKGRKFKDEKYPDCRTLPKSSQNLSFCELFVCLYSETFWIIIFFRNREKGAIPFLYK